MLKLIIYIIFAVLCYKIAKDKNRNPILWAILGFLFSVIALIILLLLPNNKYITQPENSYIDHTSYIGDNKSPRLSLDYTPAENNDKTSKLSLKKDDLH